MNAISNPFGALAITVALWSIGACGASPSTPSAPPAPAAPACTFTIPSTIGPTLFADASGASFAVPVTAPAGCLWSASSRVDFIVISEGATGVGSGTVRVSVTQNAGPPRAAALVVAGNALTISQSAPLTTIVEFTGAPTATSGGFFGQSFTLPSGGPFNFIRFSWVAGSRHVATGNVALLSQEFLDTLSALNESAPGFMAWSDFAASGETDYRFPSGVTLNGGTRYWVYCGILAAGAATAFFVGEDRYPGGDAYRAGTPTLPFSKPQQTVRGVPVTTDWNFVVLGSPKATSTSSVLAGSSQSILVR